MFKLNSFHYAGIGSRKINFLVSNNLIRVGFALALSGGVLESGAADGSDTSFEVGAKFAYDLMCDLDPTLPKGDYSRVMNIHLGWKGFNGRTQGSGYSHETPLAAEKLTAGFHPGWGNLSDGARKLMSRNAMQVLTRDLASPVRFVMCHTSDGASTLAQTSSKTGGTGQAIRIAEHYGVRVRNLGNKDELSLAMEWCDKFFERASAATGINVEAYLNQRMSGYIGFENVYLGSMREAIESGSADIIIHDSSTYHDSHDPISKMIYEIAPAAMAADSLTRHGDKKKLGTYSESSIEVCNKQITVLNAYTQLGKVAEEKSLNTDYEAVRKVLRETNKQYRNKTIAMPRMGATVGNGCWFTLSNIIQTELKSNKVILLDSPELLGMKQVFSRSHIDNNNKQMEFKL
ncbi:hypothetical protein D3C79_87090 [compost metagenome]